MSTNNETTVPESTEAISNYDGIFKSMYDDGLRELFTEGRKLLAAGDWTAGKAKFERALGESKAYPRDNRTLEVVAFALNSKDTTAAVRLGVVAKSHMDLDTREVVVSELNRYEQAKISSDTAAAARIDWDVVADRDLERLDESLFRLPQGVFFLDIGRPGQKGHVRLLGRKLLSDFWISFKIPELFCSFVTADMILGLFVDQRLSDNDVRMYYNPLTNSEKLRVMEDVMTSSAKKAELIFPFPLLRQPTRCEQGSPPEGWVVDDAYDTMLGCGEERIRAYSITFLESVGAQKPVLYDPACSTGVFLASLQKAFPGSYTIGQDLSQQMTDFARKRVNEAHCGNAIQPKIRPGTADAVYIRFLNSEVVKTQEADELLSALTSTVKDEGYFVTFGHTPVLLSSSNFRRIKGFKFLQSIGVSEDKTGIFQYYVMQKI